MGGGRLEGNISSPLFTKKIAATASRSVANISYRKSSLNQKIDATHEGRGCSMEFFVVGFSSWS